MLLVFVMAHLARGPAVFQVPYRLAPTNHILLRARLNGHGPYNFILDTGAPALFVAEDVAKRLSIHPNAKHWGVVNRLEIEGGPVVDKIDARVEGPFQLQAMNQLALTGVTIHGVIGYNVLARYRIELDMKQPAMTWTRLGYSPPAPATVTEAQKRKMVKPAENQKQMESMAKMAGAMFAKKPAEVLPRGFIGAELAEGSKGVAIKSVLPGSPAAEGGLRSGDAVTTFTLPGKPAVSISSAASLIEGLKGIAPDDVVVFGVMRGSEKHEISVRAGKGGL